MFNNGSMAYPSRPEPSLDSRFERRPNIDGARQLGLCPQRHTGQCQHNDNINTTRLHRQPTVRTSSPLPSSFSVPVATPKRWLSSTTRSCALRAWGLLGVLLLSMGPGVGGVLASSDENSWQECRIQAGDHWSLSSPFSPVMLMQKEYERRYSCPVGKGAQLAARYTFVSECTKTTFTRSKANECLRGRRVIFLGDSLGTQQADSLVSMLGWHVHWMRKDDIRSNKFMLDDDGRKVPTVMECYRQKKDPLPRCERCFDLFADQFYRPVPREMLNEKLRATRSKKFSVAMGTGKEGLEVPDGAQQTPPSRHLRQHGAQQQEEYMSFSRNNVHEDGCVLGGLEQAEGTDEQFLDWEDSPREMSEALEMSENSEDLKDDHPRRLTEGSGVKLFLRDNSGTSVHMRFFPTPANDEWLRRAVADFNETRPSDVFVVNFGAHYHDTPEEEELFRSEIAPVLDYMGELADKATVVWREMSPSHFPSANGSYDSFQRMPIFNNKNVCCTGTPPSVDHRNQWVEEYLARKGLSEKVKILRIYQMSRMRGAAHHTCHLASPTRPGLLGTEPVNLCPLTGEVADCRHWSEPGVVEEWNKLMLNHLCPAHE